MQAEGIKAGDRYDALDDDGRVIGGWTATGDAVVKGGRAYAPVKYYDGSEGTNDWPVGTQVPLTFGVGVKYPKGTPEYDAYAAELRGELAKFVAGEAPYNLRSEQDA